MFLKFSPQWGNNPLFMTGFENKIFKIYILSDKLLSHAIFDKGVSGGYELLSSGLWGRIENRSRHDLYGILIELFFEEESQKLKILNSKRQATKLKDVPT